MMEQQQDVGILRVGNHWVRFSEIIVIECISYVLSYGKEAQKYEFTMKGTNKVITVSKEEFDSWVQRLNNQGILEENNL